MFKDNIITVKISISKRKLKHNSECQKYKEKSVFEYMSRSPQANEKDKKSTEVELNAKES